MNCEYFYATRNIHAAQYVHLLENSYGVHSYSECKNIPNSCNSTVIELCTRTLLIVVTRGMSTTHTRTPPLGIPLRSPAMMSAFPTLPPRPQRRNCPRVHTVSPAWRRPLRQDKTISPRASGYASTWPFVASRTLVGQFVPPGCPSLQPQLACHRPWVWNRAM